MLSFSATFSAFFFGFVFVPQVFWSVRAFSLLVMLLMSPLALVVASCALRVVQAEVVHKRHKTIGTSVAHLVSYTCLKT